MNYLRPISQPSRTQKNLRCSFLAHPYVMVYYTFIVVYYISGEKSMNPDIENVVIYCACCA